MQTIIDLFEGSVARYKNNIFLWEKQGEAYEGTTYGELKEQVDRFAAGLVALGIQTGDRIALLSEGRNDWVVAELGILYAGGVNVPLSVKLGDASEIQFRLVHSGARAIVISRQQARKIKYLKSELPLLEKIILLDPQDYYEEKEVWMGEVQSIGEEYIDKDPTGYERRWKSIRPVNYANICYTSGTTADPKGIILTHRNYAANVEQARSLMEVPEWYTTLLILPWDHSFAHTAGIYTLMSAGASMASVKSGNTPMETLKNIPGNIREVKPVFMLSVPALAKNFKKNIEGGIREKGKLVTKLFSLALKVAYAHNGNGYNKGQGWRFMLAPVNQLFDRILFSKIREVFGGRMRFFIGGGALLDIELQRFFYAIGIPMFQGYGLSEASPIISSNSASKHKLGSSGYLVSNIELRILDEHGHELPVGEKGEIVVRGENVMEGYWDNPAATAETIKGGWLFTGDLGYLDSDGFLHVLGRFKSLLISDDGEKYSPEGIEEAMVMNSPFIEQCMLYNNQNAYTVALIYPSKEAIRKWLVKENLSTHTTEGQIAVLKMLESEINEYRVGRRHEKMFPQRWLPAAIGILEEGFTEDNHLMNSTMKIVRGKIVQKHAKLLTYLYTPEAKDICNELNLDVVSRYGFTGNGH